MSRTGSASGARRPRRADLARAVLALLTAAGLLACGPEGEEASVDPAVQQPDDTPRRSAAQSTHDQLVAAMEQPQHPSDGGGRAWLDLPEGEDGSVPAGHPGSWHIVYEAGPLGVAEGGAVYLQVSPFWGWSTPQADYVDGAGYTEVTTDAEGVELAPETIDRNLMAIQVRGRELRAGETVRMHFGAGPLGAHSDSYAEKNSRFWIAVDGDGDGVRKVLVDSPGVDIRPGPPARLVLTITSTAHPGDTLRLTAAVLDPVANAGPKFSGTIELIDPPAELELPASIELGPQDLARRTVEGRATAAGLYRLRARATLGGRVVETTSNPLLVTTDGPRILWADLHGHSAVSDGTGTPEDYYLYARDVAALDIAALTDHDHWGLLFMDEHPELWEENKAVGDRFHAPERFVAVNGFEWTNWIFGHRHVLYFSDEAPLLSSLDERYDHPDELWEALRELDALTVPHHPAGGPVPIDWDVVPDPLIDTCVEVTSAHGCSEAPDCPRTIYSAVEGDFARDALARGYTLGFIGSGDSHDGHPGLTHLGPHYPTGGLTAVLSDELTRPGVLEALRARRAYATSGPRIILRTALGNTRMGSSVPAEETADGTTLFVQAHGQAAILRVEVIRSGSVFGLAGDGSPDFAAAATLDGFSAGEYLYVRVIQEDGGMAWSGPIFLE